MSDGLRIEGLDQLEKLGVAYRNGSKTLRREIALALREAAKPVGEQVLRAGAERMPKRGGLAAKVAAGRASADLSMFGSTDMIGLILSGTAHGAGTSQIGSLDEGHFRHPVFKRAGRGAAWVLQNVPAKAFAEEFDKHKEELSAAALIAVNRVTELIAREA